MNDPASTTPVSPPRIPDHELIKRIGRGAYGEVWLARSVTGAYRAVKIVTRSSFDHERPFEREFEGILKFEPISRQHESQVDILHVGRSNGYFYYVMELADDVLTGGQINPENYSPRTLKSEVFQRARVPFEECVQIGVALTTALENLHENGLVHRDVKPSNIIFVNGVPKLADIGLVAGVDATRSYVGTEGFAAPEGSGTPQADLYSLGKVLYEIATGKDRQEFPELPTQLRELPGREGLMELNAVIARACRHDPKDRYTSATEMRADLELLQSGKSLARLHRVERRLRVVRRAGAIVTALALIGFAAFWFQARQTRHARELAAHNRRLADENRQRVLERDTGNGVREMEAGDLGTAMLWFADALKYATNDPAQAEMHRRRLSMLLQLHPKPLAVIPILGRTNDLTPRLTVSPNGRRMLVNAGSYVELWELSLPPERLIHVDAAENTHWREHNLTTDGGRFVLCNNKGEAQAWTIKSSNDVQVTPLTPKPIWGLDWIDDDQIVSVLDSNRLIAIDCHSGKLIRVLAAFEMPIDSFWVSTNGQALVMLTNHLARVMELTTGRVSTSIKLARNAQINFLDPTGRFAVSSRPRMMGSIATKAGHAASDFQAQILDLTIGRPIGPPLNHENFIWRITHSGDGRRVATASADKTARVWNLFTGDPSTPPLSHSARVGALAFSQDNARLASGDDNGNVQVWESVTGQPLIPRLRHGGACMELAFARDGAILVTLTEDGLVTLWDLGSIETPVMTFDARRDAPDVLFSPNGEFFLVSSGATRVWRVRDWSLICTIQDAPFGKPAVKFSPDSQFLSVIDGKPRSVRVWNLQTSKLVGVPLAHGSNSVWDVSFSPDGGVLATAGQDKTVRLWDWKGGRQLGDPLQHTGQVISVLFSPRGDRMLTTTSNRTQLQPWLWDVQRRSIIAPAKACETRFGLRAPIFSSDGSKWLMADVSSVQVMSAWDGQAVSPLMSHDSTVSHMNFSPDGKRVITGSFDQTARAWDSATGQPLFPPLLHDGTIGQCNFSQDNRMIVTRAGSSIRLWDAASGLPMGPSLPFQGRRAAFHPSGRILAVAANRRGVVVNLQSDVPPEQLDDLIHLTTGETISADGALQKLGQNELLDLDARIRRRQPERFMLSEEQLGRWHEGQIWEFHLNHLEPSLFHSECLLKLQPTNTAIRERHAQLVAQRVPARDPAAPDHLIDLTDHYTRSFGTMVAGEFDGVPQGIKHLGSTEFDLRGLVVLDHAAPWRIGVPGEPPQVSHIRVAQRCQRLHFLQTFHGDSAVDGIECGRFVIHYADGSQRTQSMRYGHHLSSWRFYGRTAKPVVKEAVVAWEGRDNNGARTYLYKATWENPSPDLEITHLEFQYGKAGERPMLVAITAE